MNYTSQEIFFLDFILSVSNILPVSRRILECKPSVGYFCFFPEGDLAKFGDDFNHIMQWILFSN